MLKKFWLVAFCALLLLTGCERPATRSNWSPIDSQAAVQATPSLEATLPPPVFTPEPTETLAVVQSTLDINSLPKVLPHSEKGYELYSWQTGSDWTFTLITGTNRTKAFDEIITPTNSISADGFVKLSVSGVDSLKKLLALLPSGEQILWGGMDLGGQVPAGTIYLSFPPQDLLDEMKTYCKSLGLTLTSLNEQ